MTPDKQAKIEELAAKVHTHQRLVDALAASNIIGLGPEEAKKAFQTYAVAQAVLFELQSELTAAQQP